MTTRHDNPSQLVKPTGFLPLLHDESPYFNNLNRAPKTAYDYADSINKIISYGGSVSRVKASSSSNIYNLYNIVKIVDGETIVTVTNPVLQGNYDRFAIVVTERDSEGYYIVCTFCPNFVYPSSVILFSPAEVGNSVFIDAGLANKPHMIVTTDNGKVVVGKVTGKNSIFFCGTVRLF